MGIIEGAREQKEELSKKFQEHVGMVIRKNREHNGISRTQLAAEMDVDPSTLSRYELGTQDIQASRMAYASAICGFPMNKYTEIYGKSPSYVPEAFMDMVHIAYPPKPKKNTESGASKEDGRPPKPIVVWDDQKNEWAMIDRIKDEREIPQGSQKAEKYSDEYFYTLSDMLLPRLTDDQISLLLLIDRLLETETVDGSRKCPQKLKKLLKAVVDYIDSKL